MGIVIVEGRGGGAGRTVSETVWLIYDRTSKGLDAMLMNGDWRIGVAHVVTNRAKR